MQSDKQPELVLASGSKYRKRLLQTLGLRFVVHRPDLDETPYADEKPAQLVKRLSLCKAAAVETRAPGAVIIGSDQCASLGAEILGKPGDFDRACAQLELCSGKVVVFHTGLCVLDTRDGNRWFEDVTTRVRFRNIDQKQIEAYLHRDQPYDCAGSFRSESLGVVLCESIESTDPGALQGMPLITLAAMLARAGFKLLRPSPLG